MSRNTALPEYAGRATGLGTTQVCVEGDPRCPPPDVTITPSGGTFTSASQSITVDWCGHTTLAGGTREIRLNGVLVTSSFTYTTSARAGCTAHASSTGTVTLPAGTSTVTAYIEDALSQIGTNSATYTLSAAAEGALLSFAPQNGTNRNVSLCVASCFDQVLSYSTPSYRSMDQDRSLTLVYRSSQATPIGTVTVDARDTVASKTATQLSLTVYDPNGAIAAPERVFTNQVAVQSLRLAVQFDASTKTTGSYPYTAVVKSYYSDGTTRTTSRQVRVMIVNERSSPYGAGWSVAGLQRAYPEGGGTGITVVDGMGSAQYFAGPCVSAPCNYTSPAGDYTTMSRVATGWTRRYPDGTLITFDANGFASTSQDRFANTMTYYYSGTRLYLVTDPTNNGISLSTGAGSYTITAPGSRVSTVTLDGANRVTSIIDPAGGHPFTAQSFDGSGYRVAQWLDRRGGGWNATFDCSGHLASTTAPTIVANGVSMRPVVQGAHPDAQTTACAQGSPATAVLDANATATTTDARNNLTTYYIDRFVAPTLIIDPLGQITRIERDSGGRVNSVTMPSGYFTRNTWTGPNVTRVDEGLRTINYQYDSRYNMLIGTSGHTPSVVNYLNAAGTLVDSTRVSGAVATRFKYDARGRDTLTIDPEGHTTRTHFGGGVWDNTSSVEVGAGHTMTYSYDNAGRANLKSNALNEQMQTSYDPLSRVSLTVGPRGDTTTYAYDSLFLWRVTDAKHQTTQYDRNALGWVTTLTDPGSRTVSYTYDPSGNAIGQTNRRGQAVTASYDALNRPLQLNVDPQRTTTFTYGGNGLWMTAANGASTDTISFDGAGRRIAEIARLASLSGLRMTDTSVYSDTMNVRESLAWADQPFHFVRYTYNSNYQLESVLTGGWYTSLGYNADRKASTTTFPSGVVQNDSYTADHATSVTSFSPAGGAGDVAFQTATHQDSVGRVTERYHYADTSRVYSYDPAGQLTGYYDQILGSKSCHFDMDKGRVCTYPNQITLGGESYSYDLVGNRTDGGTMIDPGDRLRSFQGFTLNYDPDGNLVRKIKAGVADDSLEWNALGELTRVWRNDAVVAAFAYDGFGRRVTKTAGGTTINYQWDDDQVIAERDGSGNFIAEYAMYPGGDKPHSVTTAAGTFAMTTETPGNVTGLMGYTSGAVSAQYSYKPFGSMERNDQAVTNSLRFQGRPYDPETGLYYFRARYYDPMLTRFVSEDPSGLDGGINPYVFAGNDPVNNTDPTGLDICYTHWVETVTQGGVEISRIEYDTDEHECGDDQTTGGELPGPSIGPVPDGIDGPGTPEEPEKTKFGCGVAVGALTLSIVETVALAPEAVAVWAGEGALAATGLVLSEAIGYKAIKGNTTRAVSLMMLHQVKQISEGGFVQSAIGEKYGAGSYLKDLIPGLNVVFAGQDVAKSCSTSMFTLH